MPAEASAGSVSVEIVPDTAGFGRELTAGVTPQVIKVGERAGRQLGQLLGRHAAQGLRDALRGVDVSAIGTRSGAEYGKAFARTANATIRAGLKDQRVNVDVDTSRLSSRMDKAAGEAGQKARARISEGVASGARDGSAQAERDAPAAGERTGSAFTRGFTRSLAGAFDALPEVEIDADSTAADREIADVRASLASLQDQEIGVDVDAAQALAQVRDLEARLAALSASSPDVRIQVDAGAAQAALTRFSAQAARVDADDITVNVDVDSGRAVAGLTAIGAASSGATPSVGMLAAVILTLGPALVPLGAAAIGGIAAIGVAAVGAAGAVGVLAMALIPVIGAVQALGKAEDQSGQAAAGAARSQGQMAAASDGLRSAQRSLAGAVAAAREQQVRSAEQVAAATRSVADARREAAAQEAEAARRVRDARRDLADVKRDAARDEAAAARQVQDAEESLARAQRDFLSAQLAVNDARKQAAKDLEDLQSRLAGSVLDEESAQIRLAEARQRAAEVASDPKSTELDRRKAILAVKEATLALSDQGRELVRLREEQAKASRAGVEGSDAVTNAQKRTAQARRQVGDAEQRVADASAQAGLQQEQSARRVADAQQGVRDAVTGAADAHREASRKVADAELALAVAVRSSAEQQRRSAASVASAQQAVVSAQRGIEQAALSAGSVGGAAMLDLQQRMAALSPEGRAFAQFIAGTLLPQLREIPKVAQSGFLPGLQDGIRSVLPYLGGFTTWVGRMGAALGELAREAGATLAGPWWRQFFSWLGGTAITSVQIFARTLGNLTTGFAGLFQAFSPVGMGLGKSLEDLSARFAEFGKSAGGSEAVQALMGYLRETGPVVAQTIASISRAFTQITVALSPIGPVVLQLIGQFANLIAAMPPWAIQAVAISLTAVSVALSVMGLVVGVITAPVMAFTVTIGTLSVSLGVIIGVVAVVVAALALLGLAVVQAYQHWDVFRTVVDTVAEAVGAAVGLLASTLGAAFSQIAGTIHDVLGVAFTWLLENAVRPAFSGIRLAISAAWSVIKVVFAAIRSYIESVLIPVFKATLLPQIQLVWALVTTAIQLAWSVIKVIFAAIKMFVESVLAPVFTWLKDVIFIPVFNGIASFLSATWNNVLRPIFSTFGDFISKNVAPPFRRGVDAIKAAWDSISDAAKIPVRFMVNTIINKGIIGTWNKVAGWFGVDPVDEVKLPEGFARGGRVNGPGTATSDSVLARLSAGEYVINAAAVKALGLDFLDLLNAAGGKVNVSGDPGRTVIGSKYAAGGVVQQVRDWLPSVDPLPYVWGGVGPGGYDCSGLTGEVFNRLTGRPSYRRAFTTRADFPSLGFKPGTGMYTIGVSRTHMVGNLASLPFEAKGSKYGIFVGQGARSVMSLPKQYYLENLGPGGNAEDAPPGFDFKNPLGWVRRAIGHWLDKMKEVADNPLGRMLSAIPRKLTNGIVSKLRSALNIIPGFSGGGPVLKYDSGGWIPPGVTTVVNRTGHPEPVLTPQQWDQLATGATVNVEVTNPVPETASESTTRVMRRLAAVGMFG